MKNPKMAKKLLYVCKRKQDDGTWRWEHAANSGSFRPTFYKSKAALANSAGLSNYIECKFYRKYREDNPPPEGYKSFWHVSPNEASRVYRSEVRAAWKEFEKKIKPTSAKNLEEAMHDGKVIIYEIDEDEMLEVYLKSKYLQPEA